MIKAGSTASDADPANMSRYNGYLVHCLLDHMHRPWRLLPHIREIEVSFTFTDFGCAWAAPIR
jgi:hypothetical protein